MTLLYLGNIHLVQTAESASKTCTRLFLEKCMMPLPLSVLTVERSLKTSELIFPNGTLIKECKAGGCKNDGGSKANVKKLLSCKQLNGRQQNQTRKKTCNLQLFSSMNQESHACPVQIDILSEQQLGLLFF